ncbi:GNAT family N-acetyltransferase [Nonomuraea maheshkhaliensis]|uniref:GNAT family N-acetyltransferase n=2 Tax=Nonomuraea maheshkhaliensis TaxID=419590 RepID=A0ABN2F5I7_9ACTN
MLVGTMPARKSAPPDPAESDWADVAALAGPGGQVAYTGEGVLPRTVELGVYLGIRRSGELVAMAGERLHPPGWTEISAVCTHPAHRGQGLATRLVLAVAAGIRARGETPFLHAAASNTNAISLYERLGFRLRRSTRVASVGAA